MRLVALVLLAGCGRIAFDDRPPDEHSGTRLKLVWLDFDGVRVPDVFYDSLLGIDCVARTLVDGTVRCTPRANIATLAYTDAGCTQPAVEVPTIECNPADYVAVAGPYDCAGTKSRIYPLGSELAQTMRYARDGMGACVGPVPVSGKLVSVGPEVNYDELVELVLTIAPSGTRARAEYYEASDGFRARAPGYYDDHLAAHCGLMVNSANNVDAMGICLPERTIQDSPLYEDAACSVLKADDPYRCGNMRFAVVRDACFRLTLFEVAPAPGDPLYFSSGGSCIMSGANPTHDYYSFGPEVSPISARFEVTSSNARIAAVTVVVEGTDDRYVYPYDQVLDQQCDIYPDGRCIPSGPTVGTFFSDAACTSSIELVLDQYRAECGTVPAKYATRYSGCMPPRLFQLGAQYTGQVYAMQPTCTPWSVPGLVSTFYTPGAEITDFATSTRVIDD